MHHPVSLLKRFAAGIYEAISLVAIWLLCTAIFVWLFGSVNTVLARHGLQILLWVITGAYFIVCWVKTGQTLAAQAWKIKLVNLQNQPLNISQAALRYGLATLSIACFGLGFLWALIDKEHLFLHDRVLKTRFIQST